jgi:hypothetical protein
MYRASNTYMANSKSLQNKALRRTESSASWIDVTYPSEERTRTRRGMPRGADIFTAAEHLLVQMEIEKRAEEIWVEGGCRENSPLGDWLQAERQVVEQFLQDRFESRRDCPRERRIPAKRAQSGSGLNRKGHLYGCLPRENRR